MRKASVKVCEHMCGKISILYKGHQLAFEIFDKTNQPAEIVCAKDINQKVNAIIKNPKVPNNHPWKKYFKMAIAVKNEKLESRTTYPQGSQAYPQ